MLTWGKIPALFYLSWAAFVLKYSMLPDAPILEFDPAPTAILEPSELFSPVDVPERCVICFFDEVVQGLAASGRARVIAESRSEIGTHPLYELDVDGERLAVFHPGIGAPLAVGLLEEMIARGCRKFIACGGAGVLKREIAVGHLLIPTSAVRDEGTSYHYLPPSHEAAASLQAVAAIERVLQRRLVDYLLTKTWTTDAIYRETSAKAAARLAEGCLTVEMEAAAFFAVAQFRGVQLGQILYGGDAVIHGAWDSRDWISRTSMREQLFWLAAEIVLGF
jgi:uridine phosphorylase